MSVQRDEMPLWVEPRAMSEVLEGRARGDVHFWGWFGLGVVLRAPAVELPWSSDRTTTLAMMPAALAHMDPAAMSAAIRAHREHGLEAIGRAKALLDPTWGGQARRVGTAILETLTGAVSGRAGLQSSPVMAADELAERVAACVLRREEIESVRAALIWAQHGTRAEWSDAALDAIYDVRDDLDEVARTLDDEGSALPELVAARHPDGAGWTAPSGLIELVEAVDPTSAGRWWRRLAEEAFFGTEQEAAAAVELPAVKVEGATRRGVPRARHFPFRAALAEARATGSTSGDTVVWSRTSESGAKLELLSRDDGYALEIDLGAAFDHVTGPGSVVLARGDQQWSRAVAFERGFAWLKAGDDLSGEVSVVEVIVEEQGDDE